MGFFFSFLIERKYMTFDGRIWEVLREGKEYEQNIFMKSFKNLSKKIVFTKSL